MIYANTVTREVSLVKRYYTAGWNLPGCLPENTPTPLFVTLDEAREYLADALDRAADDVFSQELENARHDYAAEDAYRADIERAHEASTSIMGSAELVRSDRDGDITWSVGGRYGHLNGRGWSTSEPDDYVYWIEPAQL